MIDLGPMPQAVEFGAVGTLAAFRRRIDPGRRPKLSAPYTEETTLTPSVAWSRFREPSGTLRHSARGAYLVSPHFPVL